MTSTGRDPSARQNRTARILTWSSMSSIRVGCGQDRTTSPMIPLAPARVQPSRWSFFFNQSKNCIISKLSTSSRYTQHSQSTHALSSSKSQFQTCVKNQIEGHTGIHSASRLRTSAQRTATNIPVGWNEHNLLFPSCVFLLPLSATDEEETLIPIYPIQD